MEFKKWPDIVAMVQARYTDRKVWVKMAGQEAIGPTLRQITVQVVTVLDASAISDADGNGRGGPYRLATVTGTLLEDSADDAAKRESLYLGQPYFVCSFRVAEDAYAVATRLVEARWWAL